MIHCRLCDRYVSDGIYLSDGSMIHDTCLNLLQNKAIKSEEELMALQSKLSHFEHELERREGIGFKIVSIFTKPDIETIDIEKSIPVLRNNIELSSNTLSAICLKLHSVYDYFLTYPPDWDERKNEVINRDGEKCTECGSRHYLHLHHIIPFFRGGNNVISNLTLLCEDCHSKKHGGRDFTGEFSSSETAFSKRVSNIRYAIEHGKRVEFGYRKRGEEGYKKRRIEPLELVNFEHRRDSDSTLCVFGFCELRKANRNFALKRMRGLKII